MTLKAGAIRFNTDLNQLEIYEGGQWTGMSATSPDLHTNGTRGLGAGGEPFTTQIQYWNISSTGNGLNFGDLSANRQYCGNGQASSRSRGLFMGGRTPDPTYINNIEYVTIASVGDAIDFGDLTDGGHYAIVGSNSTRAIAMGRYDGSAVVNVIDHCTIAHTGDAKDFGDSITAISDGAGAASPTRMLAFAGNSPSKVNTIQFVTISTLGDAAEFGDLTNAVRSQICGSSNAVRACTYGGHDGSSRTDHIEFVTIATLGNTKDFGNLSSTRRIANATSSSTRGLISGGYEDPSIVDTMEYIQFASTGDAIDFGNLHTARYAMTGAASNGHGGL